MIIKPATVEVPMVFHRSPGSLSLFRTIAAPRRQVVLLAPSDSNVLAFQDVEVDPFRHHALLAEAQRLRGKAYLDMGALDPSQLSEDGRLVHAVDDRSWHLMTLDDAGHVIACLRYLVHPSSVPFSTLTIAHCALAQSATWGQKLRVAVEAELRRARKRGCSYVEMGGWAITETLRCTTEALRMIATAFALAQASGGALGITNANLEGCSASILRRIGGQRLMADGVELPPYSETGYKSFQTEVLCFDSAKLNPRYKRWMLECQAHLPLVPVIQQRSNRGAFTAPFINTISLPMS
jgi:hypothetical protein